MYADLKKNEHLRRRFGSLKALIGEGSRIYPFGDVVFVSTVGNDNFDLVIEADGEHTFLQLYEDYRKRVPIVVDEIGKSVYKVGERIYMLNATGGGGGGMTPEEVQEMIRALIVNLFADAEYNTASREINFLNGDGETVATIDATNFIKDGMVQSVAIVNGNLVITFNTDSGQQPISIPLTDIFDPENYYTKDDIDEILASDYYNKRNVDTKFAASDMRMSEKNVTVSTASAPSSSTLTYVSKTGETMNHIIGDKRIVPNAESSTGYDIYFLADIVEGEAKWIQGGGGDDLNEKIHINLTSNQPGDTTLYGVRVKVETEGGDTLLDTTWQGQQLSCRVAPLIRYTVSVGSVQDYYLEAGEQEYMSAIGDIREVTFAYSTTVVTFLPTSNQGAGDTDIESATGSINGTAVAYGGSRKVATGSQVTVVADALAEYVAPAQWTGTASGASLQPVMLYQTTLITVTWESNLGEDAVIDAVRAAVAGKTVASGQTIKVATGTQVSVAFPDVQGYRKPSIAPFAAEGTSIVKPVVQYSTDIYTVGIDSNQADKSDIQGIKVTVNDGTEDRRLDSGDTVKIPTGTTPSPTAPDVSGYYKTLATDSGTKTITAMYSTEKVTVSVSADEGDPDLSGVIVTVTDETAQEAASKTGNVYLIPSGHQFSVAVSGNVDGYTTPEAQTGLTASSAQGAARTVAMEYVLSPIMYAYVKIDQTQSGDTAMISVSDTLDGQKLTCPTTSEDTHPNAAIEALRRASHLYLGKQTEAGKQLLCQLSDSNGNQYYDGTEAKFDGTEGDHWLRIDIDFYVKRVSGTDSANIVTYGLAVGGQPDATWKQIVTPSDLLAVHEAYIASLKLYSRSGVQGGGSQTRNTFKTYARSRNASGTPSGKGYSCVTWEWHCVMAFLFYAWYGRTNSQAQCGTGASPGAKPRTLGAKNSLGMTDTTASNGNADDVKFWGLENWWGDINEFVDNVDVSSNLWSIKDISGTTKRTAQASDSSGFITRMKLSENLDLIPTGNVGGSGTTYYCDNYDQYNDGIFVARSYSLVSEYGGIATVRADYTSSRTGELIGSRLAFSGEIEIAESVADFKAAQSVG